MTRSSSSATAFAAAGLLLAFAMPGANAYSCGYDIYGNYGCSGWSGGLYAGVVIAIVIPLLLIALFATRLMRRRRARANMAYVQQPPPMQQAGAGFYPSEGQGYYQGPPQYGNAQSSMEQQAPSGNYYQNQYVNNNSAQTNPQSYAPPTSPPPAANAQSYYGQPQGQPASNAGYVPQATREGGAVV